MKLLDPPQQTKALNRQISVRVHRRSTVSAIVLCKEADTDSGFTRHFEPSCVRMPSKILETSQLEMATGSARVTTVQAKTVALKLALWSAGVAE